jgi:AcrR family transcriptional regulator
MPRRGRYARGAAKRDEILEVALRVFTANGYDRPSVREIARLTGLSQAGVLHYFSSKEELFTEVLRHRDDRNEQRYDENSGNPVTAAGLISIVEHNTEEPGLVRLFVAMSAESTAVDSAARSFFIERYRKLRSDIATDVQQKKEEGVISETLDADTIASLLIAAADGLQIQWLLDPENVDMGARLQDLWRALRPGGNQDGD